MLVELRVRDLGVIEDVAIELGAGMTALTGETGAGKTLLVEALELLVGGRADSALVRPGAQEALVEGRFLVDGEEVIVARAVAARGRSRAWVDGRMAPVATLSEMGARLFDLHGQHTHQSLLDAAAQRRALDTFGAIDVTTRAELESRQRDLLAQLEALGGDDRARAREADLLRYQLDEIDAAHLTDVDEDQVLAIEEERLADASALRQAAAAALSRLQTGQEDPAKAAAAADAVGEAISELGGRGAFEAVSARLLALQRDLADVASELRVAAEEWEDDPERLEALRARRQLFRDLGRKYGEGVAEILAYGEQARRQLADIESAEQRAGALTDELAEVSSAVDQARQLVAAKRRGCAGELAHQVEERLRTLAMPQARLEVQVGDDRAGDDVCFLLGANPGEPLMALAKVASGGELARTMLALRLVCSDAPPTMVFDEVDAGVGGEAALAVGRALAEVASHHQVLVVTHLAQVAAFADKQWAVAKRVREGRTSAEVVELDDTSRVVELARMLSGKSGSDTARRHAQELLEAAAIDRKGAAVV